MRVALLNQYYRPAEPPTAVLAADLAESLVAAGHEVTVICSRHGYTDPHRSYAGRELLDGVEVRRTRATAFGRGGKLGRVLDYASYLLSASWTALTMPRPDVIVSMTTPPMLALPALVVSRLRGARFLFWVMDVYPDLAFALGVMGERSWLGRLLTRMARMPLAGASCVIALGETMASLLASRGARTTAVVHNWVDGRSIAPREHAGHPWRARMGWDDLFVVMYSGNLGLAHEFDTLTEAAERLRDEARVRFAVVGSGPRREALEREVRRRGLANVTFHPWVEPEELGDALTSADVHLVSLRPGLQGLLVPSKIYGVLAAGRPTLYCGPDDGEIAEIVKQGPCGVRVEPGDGEDMARAIRNYLDDPGLARAHGRQARDLFERRFDRPIALASLRRLIVGEGG